MSVTKILKRCGLLAATVAVVVSFSYLLKPAAVCLQRHGWMDVYPSAIEIEGFKAFVADEMTARRCLPSSEAERAKIVEVTTSSTGSAMDAPSATSADAGNEKPSPVSGVLDGGDAGKQVEPRHEASGVRTCPSLDDTTSADVKDFVLGRRSAEMEEAGWSDAIDAGQSILAYVHVCVSSVSSLASMGVECVDRIAHGTVRFASKVVNVWLEYSQPARDAETQSFQSAMEAAGPMASRTYDAILGMASDWGVWVTELQSTGVAWVRSCLFFALKGDDGAKVTAVEEKRPLWKRWKGSGIKVRERVPVDGRVTDTTGRWHCVFFKRSWYPLLLFWDKSFRGTCLN